MRNVRVCLAQISPRLGNTEENLVLHLEAIRQAVEQGAKLIVFPELSLTGYLLRDQVPDVAMTLDAPELAALAGASSQIDIVAGFVEDSPGHLFHNSAAYFSDGALRSTHRKIYLPCYGMFEEGRDFAAGDKLRSFETRFGTCGMLICEDLWHPTSAYLLALQGAQLLLVLSAGPTRGTRPGKGVTSIGVWRELLQVTAQFQTAFLVYVNRTGCEDGLTFGGGSLAVDPFGRVIDEAPALEPALVTVDLAADVLRRARTAYPLLRDENLELVHRELDRIRRLRYDLPEDDTASE